jgi:hypothetical protein
MAAGLGFKTFTTGEVLTAADTNGYLMQGINVFASTAARDAAITSPQEGQFAFTKDTNGLWYYDGAAWVASGATGDIEGVTAGIGISGGGTSGTVTVTNSMATAIDAKGDLIAGTAADTFDRLAVGTNGQTLVADSTASTGLKWATPAGGGKVLQVVSASTTTSTTISSTTMTDTGITATITPTSATSKILVIFSAPARVFRSNAWAPSKAQLLRGATNIINIPVQSFLSFEIIGPSVTSIDMAGQMTNHYLDSPATTSATTYKLQAGVYAATSSASITFQFESAQSTITLMEIGA